MQFERINQKVLRMNLKKG